MEDIAATIQYRDVCVMLDKLRNATTIAGKEKYLRRYYDSFCKHRQRYRLEKDLPSTQEENGTSSFYCILRCLIPGADTGRKVYGLQITSLTAAYIKVLQLAPDSRDAQRLEARSRTGIHGDFADTVYHVLVPRCRQKSSTLTLRQVHEMLDTIACDDRRSTERVLTRLSEVAPATEQMWFIRLLLKSMHLGIGEQRIFSMLHPKAQQLYQRCTNLMRVCCLLADNKLTEDPDSASFDLNDAIRPFQFMQSMLCERFSGDIQPLMAADVLFLETKMDGERFQLHYADGRFVFYSRGGNDYTHSFGANYDSGRLTPHLKNLLPIGMTSIVLDGEMMVWDTLTGKFRDKGENTDVKHLSSRPDWRPCYVIYDLLYFDGRCLLDMPYVQRTHKLRELVKVQAGVLHVAAPSKVTSIDEFKRLFQLALDAGEEGVVLKKQNSVYRPGVRHGGGWYKVKADYIEGLTTDFDVLVMGGFYNEKKSFIASFLVGVIKGDDSRCEVFSVGIVANITKQRVVLNDTLKPHWHPLAVEPPPIWYRYSAAVAQGRPDVWIEPRNSVILQVRAADLAPSSAFALPKSLHFGRIEKWRKDKVWQDSMTYQEFIDMIKGKSGIRKIDNRDLAVTDITTDRKQIKMTPSQKRKLSLQAYINQFDASNIERTSDFLAGFTFCVLSGSTALGYTSDQLKAMVVRNGGEIVENPIYNNSMCVCIAGDLTFRMQTIQKSGRCNIMKIPWLVRTCEQQTVQLKPRDMIAMTDEMREQFAKSYDKFGDSYTNLLTLDELEDILQDMKDEDMDDVTPEELRELEVELFPQNSPEFFADAQALFYGNAERSEFAKIVFKSRGGCCLDMENSSSFVLKPFYVCINTEDCNFDRAVFVKWLRKHFGGRLSDVNVVNINWILRSNSAKHRLDVSEYTWHDF